jgi:hypothetical protein
MAKEKRPVSPEEWETGTGLLDDVDAYITNARFGFKEAYRQVAGAEVVLLMFDLVDADGNLLNNPDAPPAYSVGSGWQVVEGGTRIVHPNRSRIIGSSMYGRLINRVVKELKVDMAQYGSPLEAAVWDGLGFHWEQEEHKTVGGEVRTQLMPTRFLGEYQGPSAGTTSKESTVEVPAEVMEQLTKLAKTLELRDFQKAAMKIEAVLSNPQLLQDILDDNGFWKRQRG